jgi:hypothetical protein
MTASTALAIPYFAPFNGRRQLTVRVRECWPRDADGIMLVHLCGADHDTRTRVALALCRCAVEDWALRVHSAWEPGRPPVSHMVDAILWSRTHERRVEYAHALADALNVPH